MYSFHPYIFFSLSLLNVNIFYTNEIYVYLYISPGFARTVLGGKILLGGLSVWCLYISPVLMAETVLVGKLFVGRLSEVVAIWVWTTADVTDCPVSI